MCPWLSLSVRSDSFFVEQQDVPAFAANHHDGAAAATRLAAERIQLRTKREHAVSLPLIAAAYLTFAGLASIDHGDNCSLLVGEPLGLFKQIHGHRSTLWRATLTRFRVEGRIRDESGKPTG
jgi:hypothetical protein